MGGESSSRTFNEKAQTHLLWPIDLLLAVLLLYNLALARQTRQGLGDSRFADIML